MRELEGCGEIGSCDGVRSLFKVRAQGRGEVEDKVADEAQSRSMVVMAIGQRMKRVAI